MKFRQLVVLCIVVVIGAWLLGLLFKVATWLLTGILYVGAIIIVGSLIAQFFHTKRLKK